MVLELNIQPFSKNGSYFLSSCIWLIGRVYWFYTQPVPSELSIRTYRKVWFYWSCLPKVKPRKFPSILWKEYINWLSSIKMFLDDFWVQNFKEAPWRIFCCSFGVSGTLSHLSAWAVDCFPGFLYRSGIGGAWGQNFPVVPCVLVGW